MVVGVLWREEARFASVEAHAVEVAEIWVVIFLLADSDEIYYAVLLVDIEYLGGVARAVCDLVFSLARCQVVEVAVAPVVALAEPEDLIRAWQVMPVDLVDAALEKLGYGFGHHVTHVAGRGVGHAKPLLLVIARRGDEGEMTAVGAPFGVGERCALTGDVVAERGAVLIGGHLEANDLARIHIDDDAFDHGHVGIADQRIFPRLELGMRVRNRNEIHFTGLPLVLLEGGDFGRVR